MKRSTFLLTLLSIPLWKYAKTPESSTIENIDGNPVTILENGEVYYILYPNPIYPISQSFIPEKVTLIFE